ncbi:MAG: phosphoribosylformylglycinamidine cyclo-ligase [Acidobacteria bacterium RIFCSPLOWO2_12_FULL_60_22]|nr:MAG: phosphoribosylformylglycinamidine cyclo-ligase [Acidobacteria bacterium RIFCSPLOWO2_12_FULL_60_22]
MNKAPLTYANAGVDIARAERAKQRIRRLAQKTFDRNVLAEIGGFGALYALEKRRWKSPVLVSSTDGVGTKLKVAFATGSHRSVAADLVNHCVNDIAVQGAQPLFFLDYFACGRLEPEVIEQVVEGLAQACRAHRCALIGGETAEMPGLYREGEYDLAGFIVGVVERSRVMDGSRIAEGDIVLGLPSSGLHTNGYSLARKLLLETAGYSLSEYVPRLGCRVADELLKPHRSYAGALQRLAQAGLLKGAAHITGGGIPGNLPRILPRGLEARIQEGSWPEPPVFSLLREIGSVAEDEMRRAFNLGIGMALAVSPPKLEKAAAILKQAKETFYRIGWITRGRRGVVFEQAGPGIAGALTG